MGQQITPTKATELCNDFDAKYAALTNLIKKDDNRSVLFSLEEIKEYIAYLEKSNASIDGIRVYFGSYKSSNTSTVFLAPTSKGVDDTKLNALNLGGDGVPPSKKYGN